MSFKFMKFLSILLVSIFLISGCWQGKNPNEKVSSNNSVSAKTLTVLTSFYPIYISTINVTKNIPEFEIWGGVPAKKIGDRENKNLNYKLGRAMLFQ